MSTEILLDARRVKSQMTWKTFEGAIQVRSRQGFDEEHEHESTSCEKFCLCLSEDVSPGERSRLGGPRSIKSRVPSLCCLCSRSLWSFCQLIGPMHSSPSLLPYYTHTPHSA